MTVSPDILRLAGQDERAGVNQSGRPFVLYKFAATIDGRIAAADGTSQWITSPASRKEVHLLRAACHATVVGSGTQQADNPHLAVRGNDDLSTLAPQHQPLRVIVDTNAKTPADARVLDDAAPTVVAVAQDADADHLSGRCDLVRLPRSGRGLDLTALLSALYDREVRAVLLEGGPTLAGSFIAAGLVDRVIAYLAPALLGAGKPGLVDAGITTIADIFRLEFVEFGHSGPDLRLVARPVRGSAS